ncbi:MAG: amino acid ABC transporter permease [Candidatus Lambdaproteobacteria bacterium]|nr:amino acid ABC transporter permease [Candidatus Lambdaproteobacteria bacterium]
MTAPVSNPQALAADDAPPRREIGVWGWARRNLFRTWYDTLLTLCFGWLFYRIVAGLIGWGIVQAGFGTTPKACAGSQGACWAFIGDLWPLFFVGAYPHDARWRPALALLLVVALGLLTLWRRTRTRWLLACWLLAPLPILALIGGSATLGLAAVDSGLWGGLMLTLLLAVVGIVFGFPLGVVLALGRRSRLPVIRALSVGYIELIRGVPLITVLFMASIMLPLFFPSGFNPDKVLRAMIGITLFYAAYMAEVVRGGLQGLARGQEEAAAALGLTYWQTTAFIVLPQALRIVIPPMVGTFIALLKDTSLVAIVGLFDLLGIARTATANPNWLGRIVEAYVFAGIIYWVLCFSMSQASRRLELRFQTRAG